MHHHQPFFGEKPATGGLLTGCDVRIRLTVALAAIVVVVMSTRIWFGLLALAACVIGMVVSRLPLRALAGRLMGPLMLAAVVCLARMLMTGTTPIASMELGPWRLTATWEGLFAGALIASRVLGSLGIVLVLCQGTPAQELLAALRWARVPRTWIEIALLMYRYLYLLSEQAASVVAVQKVRLGYGGWRRSLRSMGSLAGIVVLRSLDQAERSHEAMVARGYQGFMPLPSLPALPRRQAALAGAWVVLVAVAYFVAERWTL